MKDALRRLSRRPFFPLVLLATLACGGGGSSVTPGVTPTVTPTVTPISSPTPTPTPVTTSTPTPTPTSVAALTLHYPVNPALRVGTPIAMQTPLVGNATEGMTTYFCVLSGALPPGVKLNPDGTLTGIPTQDGAFDYVIEAENGLRTVTESLHVKVVTSDYRLPLAGDPGLAAFRPAASASGYYVDSVHGLDSQDGTSPNKAWKTLAKLNAVVLKAGDVVRLARGSLWNEVLRAEVNECGTALSPIVFEAYGAGDAPTINLPADKSAVFIRGRYISVMDLKIQGAKLGFQLSSESQNVVLAGNDVVDVGIGIYAEGSGHRFLSNDIHDLHMIRNTPTPGDDYGALAILFMGSDMEAAWNRLVNCIAPSYDFEVDGGAFESWGATTVSRIRIHHNLADNVDGFMELTNNVDDLLIAHNLIINSRGGLCFHIDDVAGSVFTYKAIRFENNTILRDPAIKKSAIFTFLSSHYGQHLAGNDMTIRNNIIGTNRVLAYNPEALGANLIHDHNLFYYLPGGVGSRGTLKLDATELEVDPLFVDPAKTDYRLQLGSPAIGKGSAPFYAYDLDDVVIPVGGAVNMGAYE